MPYLIVSAYYMQIYKFKLILNYELNRSLALTQWTQLKIIGLNFNMTERLLHGRITTQ